jgi:hypothetical protein
MRADIRADELIPALIRLADHRPGDDAAGGGRMIDVLIDGLLTRSR